MCSDNFVKMSKIFLIFVIVAFVYCAEAENAGAWQYPGQLDQAVGRFGIMSPMMDQMRNLLNPEYWKEHTENGRMMIVKSAAPANGKPTSELTSFKKENGKLTQETITYP